MPIRTRVKGTLEILSYVAVIAASGIVVWRLGFAPSTAPAPRERVEDVTGLRIDVNRLSNVAGDGSVAIVEFSDFECPFCSQYARDLLPSVKRDLIESGVIRYIPFHFPITEVHPNAAAAASAAECAGQQGRFWQMHERLFADPKALSRSRFLHYAKELNLDVTNFENCLTDKAVEASVQADLSLGKQLRVVGTPTFFLGAVKADGSIDLRRRIYGTPTLELLTEEVEKVKTSLTMERVAQRKDKEK
jgi:protein-disulfide isomerase